MKKLVLVAGIATAVAGAAVVGICYALNHKDEIKECASKAKKWGTAKLDEAYDIACDYAEQFECPEKFY